MLVHILFVFGSLLLATQKICKRTHTSPGFTLQTNIWPKSRWPLFSSCRSHINVDVGNFPRAPVFTVNKSLQVQGPGISDPFKGSVTSNVWGWKGHGLNHLGGVNVFFFFFLGGTLLKLTSSVPFSFVRNSEGKQNFQQKGGQQNRGAFPRHPNTSWEGIWTPKTYQKQS